MLPESWIGPPFSRSAFRRTERRRTARFVRSSGSSDPWRRRSRSESGCVSCTSMTRPVGRPVQSAHGETGSAARSGLRTQEMECLLITSPSSSASLSGSQGSPDLVEAEKSAAVHEDHSSTLVLKLQSFLSWVHRRNVRKPCSKTQDSDLVMKAVMRSISLTDPFTLGPQTWSTHSCSMLQ